MRAAAPRELLIKAGHPGRVGVLTSVGPQLWQDVWQYRELLYFLAWRDVLVRYKQTVIGIAWALIKAAVTVLILTVVFGRLARMPSYGLPYPLLVLAALLPWQFFSAALTDASNSLVAGSELISKVYFPRVIVPLSAVAVSLVDFVVSGVVLAALFLWFDFGPDWRVATVPLFIALAVALAIGAGLWFAALIVRYRDFRYVLALLLQLALYISPVGFSSNVVPEQWRLVYSLNPMVGVIDGFRWALLRGETGLDVPALLISVAAAIVLLATGIHYFRSAERRFADVI